MASPAATWQILTPPAGQGAIAVLQIRGNGPGDFERLLRSVGLDLPVGKPLLRDLLGVDRGLAVRWDETTMDLFPHGGPAIVRRLVSALTERGVEAAGDEHVAIPEAGNEIERLMLETLARAASPLAVDLLLDQPRRWGAPVPPSDVRHPLRPRLAAGPPPPSVTGEERSDAHVLARLINPPLVVAVGPANIGKSTLLNALAGRAVAIVADEPGTTRDHVGATLDMGGLTVRYLDTPGRDGPVSPVDAEAARLAERAEESADLVLLCGDPVSPCPGAPIGVSALRVCLRSDLGQPGWSPDIRVSVTANSGLEGLVREIREMLVPGESLNDPRPWRFWG